MAWFQRCVHDWRLLSKETLPARVEVLMDSALKAGQVVENYRGPAGSGSRTLVQIVACTKCGKLRHFRDQP